MVKGEANLLELIQEGECPEHELLGHRHSKSVVIEGLEVIRSSSWPAAKCQEANRLVIEHPHSQHPKGMCDFLMGISSSVR